jgi:hypothetical protein
LIDTVSKDTCRSFDCRPNTGQISQMSVGQLVFDQNMLSQFVLSPFK